MTLRLALLLAALWWGGISGLAFVAVPALFAQLGSPAVAGPVAAWLFGFVCKLTWVCSGFLAIFWIKKRPSPLTQIQKMALVFIAVGVLAAGVQDLVVAEQIVSARATGGNLKLWHSLGSALVLVQWLAAGASLWRLTGLVRPQQPPAQPIPTY